MPPQTSKGKEEQLRELNLTPASQLGSLLKLENKRGRERGGGRGMTNSTLFHVWSEISCRYKEK